MTASSSSSERRRGGIGEPQKGGLRADDTGSSVARFNLFYGRFALPLRPRGAGASYYSAACSFSAAASARIGSGSYWLRPAASKRRNSFAACGLPLKAGPSTSSASSRRKFHYLKP